MTRHRRSTLVLAVSLLVASFAAADGTIRHVRPPASPQAPRYSHAVVVESGRLVFVAGQVAYDAQRHVVGKGDMAAQTRQVFENLKAVLADAGSDLAHVVRLNAYLTDMSQLDAHRAARNEYIDAANPPASTLVGVARLVDPDLLLEVEAVAVVVDAKEKPTPGPR
jgi:reactive intermediate/imine deaminase